MITSPSGAILPFLGLLLVTAVLTACPTPGGSGSTTVHRDPSGVANGVSAHSEANACSEGGNVTVSASARISLRVQGAIIKSDFTEVSIVLSGTQEVEPLAEGFKFKPSEREEALKKTSQRVTDRDVVAFKGIAQAAITSGNPEKLATVMVLATLNRRDDHLERELAALLRDKEMMSAVVAADPNKEFVPSEDTQTQPMGDANASVPTPPSSMPHGSPYGQPHAPSHSEASSSSTSTSEVTIDSTMDPTFDPTLDSSMMSTYTYGDSNIYGNVDHHTSPEFFPGMQGRRLTCSGCVPAHTYICAHCWPSNTCKKFWWCGRRRKGRRRHG